MMEAERGAPVPRRERDRVIDQVRFELLPRAFSRSQRTFAWIDTTNGYLLVDVSSDARADEFTANLQTALGALPVTFPVTQTRPAAAMTDWVANASMPDDIELERECEMMLPGEGGAVVRCRNQELASREVFTHLEAGKEVVKIAVSYAERLRFVLDAHHQCRHAHSFQGWRPLSQRSADRRGGSSQRLRRGNFSISAWHRQ